MQGASVKLLSALGHCEVEGTAERSPARVEGQFEGNASLPADEVCCCKNNQTESVPYCVYMTLCMLLRSSVFHIRHRIYSNKPCGYY